MKKAVFTTLFSISIVSSYSHEIAYSALNNPTKNWAEVMIFMAPLALFILFALFWKQWLRKGLPIKQFLVKKQMLTEQIRSTKNELGDAVIEEIGKKESQDHSSSRLVMICSMWFTFAIVSCLLSYYFYQKLNGVGTIDLTEIRTTLIALGVGMVGPYAAGKWKENK